MNNLLDLYSADSIHPTLPCTQMSQSHSAHPASPQELAWWPDTDPPRNPKVDWLYEKYLDGYPRVSSYVCNANGRVILGRVTGSPLLQIGFSLGSTMLAYITGTGK